MIWLIFLPVLALLYVVYLVLKAIIVLGWAFIYWASIRKQPIPLGELDPVTDRAKF